MNFHNKRKIKTMNKIKNIDNLNISSLFKLEDNILNQLYRFDNDEYNNKLDLKEYLIKINNKKDTYDKITLENKLIYLKAEYIFFKKQTKINNFIKKQNKLCKTINNVLKDSKNEHLILKYNNLQKKYKKILNNITKKNYFYMDKKQINIKNKICWYEFQIEQMIKKKLILDNYIFSLKNIYNDIIEEKMLDITIK